MVPPARFPAPVVDESVSPAALFIVPVMLMVGLVKLSAPGLEGEPGVLKLPPMFRVALVTVMEELLVQLPFKITFAPLVTERPALMEKEPLLKVMRLPGPEAE